MKMSPTPNMTTQLFIVQLKILAIRMMRKMIRKIFQNDSPLGVNRKYQ